MEHLPSNNQNESPPAQKGVNFVFEQSPELALIGTREQYIKYLENIFPESKLQNVVFKGVPNNFIDNNEASFYTSDLDAAKYYSTLREGDRVISAKLNLKNPLIVDAERPAPIPITDENGMTLGIFGDKNTNEKLQQAGYDGLIINRKFSTPLERWEILSFYNDARHILASENDVRQFQEFIAGQNTGTDSRA